MTLPNPDFNWGNLWADLLKGVGRGLLVHDGSRLSQAALAGLEVFDDAQERRRRHEKEEANGAAYQDSLLKLLSTMSQGQLAAFLRQPPREKAAWTEEWSEGPSNDLPSAGALPHQVRPLSANPIDGWRLQSILPFGPGCAMKSPTYRR